MCKTIQKIGNTHLQYCKLFFFNFLLEILPLPDPDLHGGLLNFKFFTNLKKTSSEQHGEAIPFEFLNRNLFYSTARNF